MKSLASTLIIIYGLISCLWLVTTNPVLERLPVDRSTLLQLAALRGSVLMAGGAWLIYYLVTQAERSLKKSSALLQMVVDGTTDSIYVRDLEERYVLVNAAVAQRLQQPVEALLGKTMAQLMPDSAAALQVNDRFVLATRQTITLEELIHLENGEVRTFLSTKYPWIDTQGNVQGLIGISRDITAYKQLEQDYLQLVATLQQQNQYLDALNTVTANAISSLDLTDLLDTLLQRLVKVSAAESGTLLLQSPQGLAIQAVVGESLVNCASGRAIALNLAAEIAASRQPVHLEDLPTDPRFCHWKGALPATRSILGVVLQRDQQLIGILLLEWQQPRPYNAQQVHLLEITAERCAMAVQRAKLFEQTKQLQDQLQLQIDRMPMGFIVTDRQGGCLEWNPAAEHIFGYTRAEVIGRRVCDLIGHPDHLEEITRIYQAAFVTGATSTNINANLRKDGQQILCEWHNTPLKNSQGEWSEMLTMVQDVTERQAASDRLRESEARFRSLIDGLPFCCWAFDEDGRYTFQNAIDVQQWGQVVGRTQDDVVSEANGELDIWQELRRRAMRGEVVKHEAEYTLHGTTQHFLTIVAPIRDGDRIYGAVGASIDITDRKNAENQLRRYAFYDLLTDLPRRTLLLERLADLLQARKMGSQQEFALIHLELGRFKVIKYSLGHRLAEELLIAMAERIKHLLPSQAMLARTGGTDEFSILLPQIADGDQGLEFVDRLSRAIAQPFRLQDYELFVHAHIGIVFGSQYKTCDKDGHYQTCRAEDLFQAADTAMNQARQAENGCYAVFDPAIQLEAVNRLQLDSELRYALTHNQLSLHYQPIVDLSNRQLVGFEALVRWHSPQRGRVSPGAFIPLAEETGLIVPLGAWVLRQACQQFSQWQAQFPDIPLFTLNVNLSTVQLLQPDLLLQIDRILQETGMPAHCLKLEITETSVVQNAQAAMPILQALKARQIRLSIDDFGTGYSSLTYLHTFPLDTLKVDRAFVKEIGQQTESLEITRTIILLAHTLGLDVVAEGIETAEQLQWLQKLGCDRGQGYFFSHPLAVDDVAAILARDCWIL